MLGEDFDPWLFARARRGFRVCNLRTVGGTCFKINDRYARGAETSLPMARGAWLELNVQGYLAYKTTCARGSVGRRFLLELLEL